MKIETDKIALTKVTKNNGVVIYFVYSGRCAIGNSTKYKEAKQLYETCLKNKSFGLPKEEILEVG